jgi:hypothetical protein
MIHEAGCNFTRPEFKWERSALGEHEDAAKRVSDGYNLHLLADRDGNQGRWLAFRLSDGTGDGTTYASKDDAIRGQRHNERYCMFLPLHRTSMSVCAAASLLRTSRMMYDLGNPQTERQELIPRLTRESQARQLQRLQAIAGRN